jgi:hypothetical protein
MNTGPRHLITLLLLLTAALSLAQIRADDSTNSLDVQKQIEANLQRLETGTTQFTSAASAEQDASTNQQPESASPQPSVTPSLEDKVGAYFQQQFTDNLQSTAIFLRDSDKITITEASVINVSLHPDSNTVIVRFIVFWKEKNNPDQMGFAVFTAAVNIKTNEWQQYHEIRTTETNEKKQLIATVLGADAEKDRDDAGTNVLAPFHGWSSFATTIDSVEVTNVKDVVCKDENNIRDISDARQFTFEYTIHWESLARKDGFTKAESTYDLESRARISDKLIATNGMTNDQVGQAADWAGKAAISVGTAALLHWMDQALQGEAGN